MKVDVFVVAHTYGPSQPVELGYKYVSADTKKIPLSRHAGVPVNGDTKLMAKVASSANVAKFDEPSCREAAAKRVQKSLGDMFSLADKSLDMSGPHYWDPRYGWVSTAIDQSQKKMFVFGLDDLRKDNGQPAASAKRPAGFSLKVMKPNGETQLVRVDYVVAVVER